MSLERLLQQRGDIWRGGALAAAPPGVLTGFAELDAELPGGGWPLGAVSEILSDAPGAFALTLPALARLGGAGRWLLLVDPPYVPYAPALVGQGIPLGQVLLVHPARDTAAWWAAEQGLRSGACGAVLTWAEPDAPEVLRRLQLAAQEGGSLAFLFRGQSGEARSSPAALRLRAWPTPRGLEVEILKRRGGFAGRRLSLAV